MARWSASETKILELESRLPELRRSSRDSARFPHSRDSFLLHPSIRSVSTADFPFPCPFHDSPEDLFPLPPPSMRLALHLHADWLIRFRRSWFLYLSPSFSLPRYPVSQRLPADWTRLGRPDNPIEFEFMDIRKRAARVAGLKGRRVTNEYLSRGRELSPEIERRDAISLSAATVSRLHYANRNGEYKFLRIFRADKTLLRLGRKRFKGVWSPTRCLHDECVRKFGWRFRAVHSEMMDRWFGHKYTQVLTRFTCWGSRGRHTKIFWYSREYIRNVIRFDVSIFETNFVYKSFQPNHVGETVSINGWSSLRYISFASLPLYLIPFFSWPSLKPYHSFSPPRNRM